MAGNGGDFAAIGGTGTTAAAVNSTIWHPVQTRVSPFFGGPSWESLFPTWLYTTPEMATLITNVIGGLGFLTLILGLLLYAGIGSKRGLGVTIIALSIIVFVLGGSTYLFGVLLGGIGGAIGAMSGRSARPRAAR